MGTYLLKHLLASYIIFTLLSLWYQTKFISEIAFLRLRIINWIRFCLKAMRINLKPQILWLNSSWYFYIFMAQYVSANLQFSSQMNQLYLQNNCDLQKPTTGLWIKKFKSSHKKTILALMLTKTNPVETNKNWRPATKTAHLSCHEVIKMWNLP